MLGQISIWFLLGVSMVARGQVSDEQILAISAQIWEEDDNRFPDHACVYNEAGPRLYIEVDEDLLQEGTYGLFTPLMDNYEREIGQAEPVCPECRQEEDLFLESVLDTRPMKTTHDFLVSHGLANPDRQGFKEELNTYWFEMYSRSQGAAIDSSGFEHVFVGEVRTRSGNDEVTGFHNWVQAYLEEQEDRFQYGQYLDTCEPENLLYSFAWEIGETSYWKPISGNWMKTSPELEMALYTLCFATRRNQNCVTQLDGARVTIINWDFGGMDNVGTAYPQC